MKKPSRQTGALVREAKANEANYLLYLSKREQERTSDAVGPREEYCERRDCGCRPWCL